MSAGTCEALCYEVLDEVQRLLDANLRVSTADISGFQQVELPDISWGVAREAVMNALVHGDCFLHQSIHLTLHDGRAEITSLGGFTGGATARNVLRRPPVRRNPLLADVLQAIGLVNRVGLGVDRIYEELLLLGKDLPRYDADESHVRLVLPTRTHAHFVRFVHEVRRGGGVLGLDDLILLRGLTRRGSLDRWTAAELRQLPEGEAAARLVSLRERGYLAAQGRGRGTLYRLAPRHAGLDRCCGPRGGRCPGRRGVGAPAVDCTRYQGDETRRGGGDCHEPRAAGCRVVAGAGAGVGGDRLCICRNDAGCGGPVSLRSTRSVHGSAHAASRSIFLRRSRSASREATAVPATLVSRARSSRGISCWSANTMTDSNVRP